MKNNRHYTNRAYINKIIIGRRQRSRARKYRSFNVHVANKTWHIDKNVIRDHLRYNRDAYLICYLELPQFVKANRIDLKGYW